MTSHSTIVSRSTAISAWKGRKIGKLALGYVCLMALPFAATFALDMQEKTAYAAFLSMFNTLAIMVFYIQFPLVGRLKHIALFANINWSMSLHKKMGQWLGIIFLLHPVLILAPRFLMSFDEGMDSLMTTIKAPQMLTGMIAWVGLIVWVLLAVFRHRLKMSLRGLAIHPHAGLCGHCHPGDVAYHDGRESWPVRETGSTGFGGGCALYPWELCCTTTRQALRSCRPIHSSLIEVKPVSSRDWQLTIEKPADSDFDFEPGQFVWINTSASGGVKDHPFSIASAKSSLPQVSFLIRNLGDYTSKLR